MLVDGATPVLPNRVRTALHRPGWDWPEGLSPTPNERRSPMRDPLADPAAPVFLTANGQDLGPDSQGNLPTTGTASLAGVPVATTNAVFAPAPPAGNTLSFSGPIVFTPISAGSPTLTANVLGTVHLGSGSFHATSTSVTGTGVLDGGVGFADLPGNGESQHRCLHGDDHRKGLRTDQALISSKDVRRGDRQGRVCR
jgi:hypothetical protein